MTADTGSLPIEAAAHSHAQGAPPATTPTHVLVVDDTADVREFLRGLLEMAGNRVSDVPTVEEALRLIQRDPPQVVLTDLNLPGTNGDELVRRLRAEHPTMVSVVLTGYGTVERTVELMRLGAFDVLTKPCRNNEILATVDKAAEHHEALAANADLRKRLRVQDKLAMIGKLAAGVAHELNNPLDATLRCVRLTQDRVQDDEEANEYLELAHAGLLRMADIVQSLLTFSRHAAVEQAPQTLSGLVTESVAAVELALGDDAPAIESAICPNAARLLVPRGLHQVLTNLLRNAFDAAGGSQPIRVTAQAKDDEVELCVIDGGPGIPDEVLKRVFEPFFTTKEPGRGTGLGLPISARLVEKFGGRISIECPSEGGTHVTVRLPARRESEDV